MVDVPGAVLRDPTLRGLVDDASAAVLANHVEPRDDMIAERLRASFDSAALAEHLNGGPKKVKRKCVQESCSFANASHRHIGHFVCVPFGFLTG